MNISRLPSFILALLYERTMCSNVAVKLPSCLILRLGILFSGSMKIEMVRGLLVAKEAPGAKCGKSLG